METCFSSFSYLKLDQHVDVWKPIHILFTKTVTPQVAKHEGTSPQQGTGSTCGWRNFLIPLTLCVGGGGRWRWWLDSQWESGSSEEMAGNSFSEVKWEAINRLIRREESRLVPRSRVNRGQGAMGSIAGAEQCGWIRWITHSLRKTLQLRGHKWDFVQSMWNGEAQSTSHSPTFCCFARVREIMEVTESL